MTHISPWLSVGNPTEALEFYRAAFGAIESERLEGDEGEVLVARLSIDDADFWVQLDPGSDPRALAGSPVRMILTVDDPDEVFARAMSAGATLVAPVAEDHGWRVGRLADPSGHHWEIGERV